MAANIRKNNETRKIKLKKTNFKKQNGYGDIRKNSKKMVQIGK